MDPRAHAHTHCLNCEAPLHGPFCARCGQDTHHTARSLKGLLHEAFESLTHLDGRLWGTLRALLIRPGHLTAEYLADRRARYIPPFRLYLVISVLFFAFGLSGEGERESARRDGDAQSVVEAREEQSDRRELVEACDLIKPSNARLRDELQAACRRGAADSGRTWARVFVETLPKTLFLFLPVVALALYLLFFRARRFYVEHLVFTLHYQAAMFLFLGLALLLQKLGDAWQPFDDVGDWLCFALFLYAGWYTWRSLRTVYRQGRVWTAIKLWMFGFTYCVMFGFTVLGTLLVSIFRG